jgi:hypothetical protein
MTQAHARHRIGRTGLDLENPSRPACETVEMPRDEAADWLASPEAMHLPLGFPSRRAFLWGAFVTAPVMRASQARAREQPAPSARLVKASVTNPLLWKPEWAVGEALVGQFTATNSDPLSPQDGSVNLILYDQSNQIENSTLISVFVPVKTTLNIVFVSGPPTKAIGTKTLEIKSALNSIKVSLTSKPALQSGPTKGDKPSGDTSKDEHCWGITTALGLCR